MLKVHRYLLEDIDFLTMNDKLSTINELVLVKGVTGFYRRLWNHLCFSHDVCVGRYHQNRLNLSANSFNTMRKSAFAAVKGAFAPSLALAA